MLNEHYHGVTDVAEAEPVTKEPTNTPDKEDDLNFDDLESTSKKDSDSTVDDNKVKELLDSLD